MSAPLAIFDCETGPRPLAEIEQFMPKEWPLGNLKDPDKIEAAVAAKRQAWLDDAALNPLTAQILVIGVLQDGVVTFLAGDEKTILAQFWRMAEDILAVSGSLVGFNIKQFDLPLLIKASWRHGVHVSSLIRTRWHGRVYFNENIIDLRDEWQLGDRQAHGSLDSISRLIGGPGKSGHGKNFATLYQSDQAAALKYLSDDLRETERVHKRMFP